MATNYLNNLNKIVKVNSATITNASNKDALVITSRRNRDDLNNISNYINSIVYPAFTMLCSKPKYPYDVLESGLSAMTIVTYPEEEGNNKFNTELFWKPGANNSDGRPCTIKESFDYIIANMVEKVVEITQATVDLNDLWDVIRCNTLNNNKVAKDAFGSKYDLSCNDNPYLDWPLARHIYEIFNQVVSGHNENNKSNLALDPGIGSDNYPNLSVTANIEPATTKLAGSVEIATINEIGAIGQKENSTTGIHELVVTPYRLLAALDVQGSGFTNRRDNILREKVKEVALEKINETSITELRDVNTISNLKDGHVLVYDSTVFDDTSAAGQDTPRQGAWVPRSLSQGDLEGTIDATSKLGVIGDDSTISDLYPYHKQIPSSNKATNTNLVWSKLFNQWTKRGPECNQGLNSKYRNLSNKKQFSAATYYKNIPYVFKAAAYSKLMKVSFPKVINYIKSSFIKYNTNAAFLKEDLDLFQDLNIYLCQNSCSNFTKNLNNEHGLITISGTGTFYNFKYDYVCNYYEPSKILGVCRSDLDFKALISPINLDDGIQRINYIDNDFSGFIDSSIVDESIKHYAKVLSFTSENEEDVLNNSLTEKQDLLKKQFLYQFGKSNAEPISSFRSFTSSYELLGSIHTHLSLSDVTDLQYTQDVPGVSSNNLTLQSNGVSKIMILGPYEMGDNVYICPESILDIRNIEGGIGIVISESFMNKTILELLIEFMIGQEKEFTKHLSTGQEVFDYFSENLSSEINFDYTNLQNTWSKTLKELLFDNVDLGLNELQKINFKKEVGTIVNSHDWSLGLIERKDEIAFGMNAFCENLLEINNNNTYMKFAAAINPGLNQNYYEDLIDYLYFKLGFRTIDLLLNAFHSSATTLQKLAIGSSYTKKNLFLRRLRSLNLVDIQILT